MFVSDVKDEFYNLLLGNRVLLLVHYDVDAVCTCKILQSLFKCDNILYTLIPVGGISQLKNAYEENHEEIKYVVLVNCGGTIDLVDILQPDEDVVFFIIDSHKPTNVCNVYSDGQVRLVWKDEEEDIPNFDDIFRDEEDEEDPSSESRENLEATLTRRRERRAWEEKRDKLMFDYTKFSYYGQPSSCRVAGLAWLLSRLSVGAAWAAAVGVSVHTVMSTGNNVLDTHTVHTLIARTHDRNESATICLEKDLCLPLYRMWSLECSLRYSPTLAPSLKMHTRSGDMRLKKLLADTGIPLQQARQAYRSMDVCLRQTLLESLEKAGERLGDVTHTGFLLKRKFSPTLAAHDMVYVITALLENEKISREEGFSRALDALNLDGESDGIESRNLGAEIAKTQLQNISSIVTSRALHVAGPFAYLIVQDGGPVYGPLWLAILAGWAGRAGGRTRPVLVTAGLDNEAALLVGVPPHTQKDSHNLFGAAFEQAATASGCSVSLNYVDSSVVSLPTAQRPQFLDALTHLLT